MALQIRKAQRHQARLRLGLAGPSGSGKTYSALLIAFGLDAGKVGLIDTERGSGDLYAHLGDYDVIRLDPPYTVAQYRNALSMFEGAGYGVVILDSISHAWAGEGGLLDKHGKIVDSSQRKDSFSAWRQVTPEHNQFIDAMLKSPCHIIATMRTKTEYVLEEVEVSGRKTQRPRKVGMAPVQREGMEYEFTLMLDISGEHIALASKDRTGLLDGEYLTPGRDLGLRLKQWLESGVAAELPGMPPHTTGQEASSLIQDNLDKISTASTMEELRAVFMSAKVVHKHDSDSMARLIEAKDTRKATLERASTNRTSHSEPPRQTEEATHAE